MDNDSLFGLNKAATSWRDSVQAGGLYYFSPVAPP